MKKLPAIAALLLLAACKPGVQPSRQTIPFVSDLIADHSNPKRALVAEFKASNPTGALYVIGSADRCQAISRTLAGSDIFDNVDAKLLSDGLPDFSGETICSVVDNANTPYRQWSDRGEEDALRENTVRCVLAALDTVSYVSKYDQDGLGVKRRAKQIILASPEMWAYGKFDCDTLFKTAGAFNPVICPLELMLDNLASKLGRPFNVGIITTPGEADPKMYSKAVADWAHSKDLDGTICTAIPLDYGTDSTLVVKNWIDAYAEMGGTGALDAFIIDDYSLDGPTLAAQALELYSVMNEQSIVYGNFFADGFRVLDPLRTIAEVCYRDLRNRNAFTHRIAYPASKSFTLIEYSDRYVQD